eukprot:CAMPEP_0174828114 /NCGR_PEP_ID=MMETSP1114-20130205/1146_1 /TAXON_ID=312471 /ORGANISM="Neobodo designis, Strain CCAP 1951/1" /LENGTH=380 /DNA_ID=CAMNT_0016061823 /DNA_START=147 /DNA_END=1289 /DNA_ORIENTATION=-
MSTPASACAATLALPFGGGEILLLACFFLFIVVTFCVTFLDVAAKQWWPSKLLDPAVAARVEEIQNKFPALKEGPASPEDPKTASDIPTYTHVVSQEAYIAGRTVDEDLVFILANNNAFSTVSSYCACTVRGYAMLSVTLLCAGITLGFLWINNVSVYAPAGDLAGKLALLGYVLVFLTGIVMTNPNSQAVNRDANICLWTNVPLKLWGHSNPTLKLHDVGIVGFVAIPLFSHIYTIIVSGKTMPNYEGAVTGAAAQLIGAVLFGASSLLNGRGLTSLQSKKCSIMAEVVCVFASFLAYLQWEFYATAACNNAVAHFNTLMLSAAAVPFGFIAKHYWCAPTSFPAEPSVLLMNGDEPAAASGPAPTLVFDQYPAAVPNLN